MHHIIGERGALTLGQRVRCEVIDCDQVKGTEHRRRVGDLGGSQMDDKRLQARADDAEPVERPGLVGDDCSHEA